MLLHFVNERLSSYPTIRRQSLYSLNDIGILFRPSLFCSGVNLNPEQREADYYDIAIAIELLQISTLVADDIFDDSPLRNNNESVQEKFGVKNAIIIAELFKSFSTEIILNNKKLKASQKGNIILNFEEAYQKICIGQFLDLQFEKEEIISEEEYFDLIIHTTGYFIQKSLLSGALVAEIDTVCYQALAEYGLKLGIAYQLRDDIVNLVTDGSNGKCIAEDLISKKKRLPVIHALNRKENKEFLKIWNKSKITSNDALLLVEILKKYGSLDYCKQHLERLRKETAKSIRKIKAGKQKKNLLGFVDIICSI